MSASAPLGRPSKKTGSVDAVCTSATRMGEVVSVVMSQAAATSFIHMQVLATIQVSQSMRNTGTDSGANGDIDAGRPPDAALFCSSWAVTEASVSSAMAERRAALPGTGVSMA